MNGLKVTVEQAPCEWTAAVATAAVAGAAAASSAADSAFPALPFPPQPPSTAALQVATTLGTPGTPSDQAGPEGGGQGGGARGAIDALLAAAEQHPDLSHAGAADAGLDEKDSAGDSAGDEVPHPPPPDAPGGPLDPTRKAAVACPPADLAVVPRRSGGSRGTRRRSRSPRERLSRRNVATFRDFADRTGTGAQRPLTASADDVCARYNISHRISQEAS